MVLENRVTLITIINYYLKKILIHDTETLNLRIQTSNSGMIVARICVGATHSFNCYIKDWNKKQVIRGLSTLKSQIFNDSENWMEITVNKIFLIIIMLILFSYYIYQMFLKIWL